MIANIDDVNEATRQIVPFREADTVELIRELYNRAVNTQYIEVIFNSLDDLYAGIESHRLLECQGRR